ncbi:MAG: hypothetical protein D6762_06095, partial [Candidatus Neomarinimicrobiota bacterium]
MSVLLLGQTPGLKQQARLFQQNGDWEQALTLYRQIIQEHPEDVQSFRELVALLRRQELYPEMVRTLNRRLQRYPNDLQTQVELGEAYELAGHPDSAAVTWSAFESRYANNPTAIRMLAFLYSRLNKESELKALVQRGRDTFRDPGFMAQEMAQYYQQRRDFTQATREYLTLLEAQPKRESMIRQSVVLMGDRADDPAVIETVLRSAPPSPARLRILAAFLYQQGRLNDAYALHETLGWQTSADVNRWLSFADNLRRDGYLQEALKAYQNVLRHRPNASPPALSRALMGMAQAFEKTILPREEQPTPFLGENRFFTPPYYPGMPDTAASLQAALSLYDSILVSLPDSRFSAMAHFRLGEIQFRVLKDSQAAIDNYQAVVRSDRLDRERSLARQRIGQLYFLDGNWPGAAAYFRRKIQSHSDLTLSYVLSQFFNRPLNEFADQLDSVLMVLDPSSADMNDLLEVQDLVQRYYTDGSEQDREAFAAWVGVEQFLWQNQPEA